MIKVVNSNEFKSEIDFSNLSSSDLQKLFITLDPYITGLYSPLIVY